MKECPICKEEIIYSQLGSETFDVTCPRCGNYHITGSALRILGGSSLSDREIGNISGWLTNNPPFEISSYQIEFLKQLETPSFHERADKLLEHLEKETKFAGQFINEEISWLSAGWCINHKELEELIDFLEETERIENANTLGSISLKIRPAGWAHLESLKKINSDKKQGFVAMWFNDEMQPIYKDIISKAIFEAGYTPHRVDQREHNDKIDDEIISQIRKSRFVLADFTGHRGGVYFEAGFAKGLGLEVFWSCREDELDNLHFDIRQYNCITWNMGELEKFKSKITNRIEAVIGSGPG